MSDTSLSPSVLVISNDYELVNRLKEPNKRGLTVVSRGSIQLALEEVGLLPGNGIVIVDSAINPDNASLTVAQILKLKKQDPSQILFLVGEAAELGEILKTNVQPLIYRAFNKPIHPNQIFLAFEHGISLHADLVARIAAGEDLPVIGSAENKVGVESQTEQGKSKSLIYAAVGLMAIGIFGWFLSGGNERKSEVADTTSEALTIEPTPGVVDNGNFDTVVTSAPSRLSELNKLAKAALDDGRIYSPEGENALQYFQQVLSIDPYDSTAYEGKKTVANRLRQSYRKLIATAKFDEALAVIQALQGVEPLNLDNDKLHMDLEQSINKHVAKIQQSGSKQDIAETSALLNKMESNFEGSQSAARALKQEQQLIAQIDSALATNNLVPPQQGNAYALVSNALKNNTISKVNYQPRARQLGAKLIASGKASIEKGAIPEAEKIAALVKRLNSNPNALASLNNLIETKKSAIAETIAAEKVKQEELALAAAAQALEPVIIPATPISQPQPRYPKRALERNVTGWVELSFTIKTTGETANILVKNSQPKETFDNAAVRAVKRWRFDPARDQATGQTVESNIELAKLRFEITD